MLIDPEFAKFAIELRELYEKLCDKHDNALHAHYPMSLEIKTVDGVAAVFVEEGINFYPEASNG